MERKLRLQIIERDGGRCRYCGERDSHLLQVHQIVSRDLSELVDVGDEWLNLPANLITLCKERHAQAFVSLRKKKILSRKEEKELRQIRAEVTELDLKRRYALPNPVERTELRRTRRALLGRQDQIRALGRFRLESRRREVADLCDRHLEEHPEDTM